MGIIFTTRKSGKVKVSLVCLSVRSMAAGGIPLDGGQASSFMFIGALAPFPVYGIEQ